MFRPNQTCGHTCPCARDSRSGMSGSWRWVSTPS